MSTPTAPMKFGVHIFPTAYSIRPDALAIAVEARGFESLFVPEHTHIPLSRISPWPGGPGLPKEYSHTYDPFIALSYAAAATKTLMVGTGICLIVERDPIITAKEVASLDVLSGGRMLFGIGGGWNAEEMADHGTDFTTRWKLFKDRLAALKVLWTEEEPEYHGPFVNFDKCSLFPKPLQRPYPPLLIAGMGSYARQRAVDADAGWLPIHGREDLFAGIEDIRRRASEAGKASPPVTMWIPRPDEATIAAYCKAGVERIIFTLPTGTPDEVMAVVDRLTGLIKPFA
jgi:probable F420-dependent oxidoreductase